MTLSIAFASIHMTRERANGSKSLQLMSKTHSITYWLSNYLFDGLIHIFNILTILAIVYLCYSVLDVKSTDFGRLFTSPRTILHLGLFLLAIVASSLTLAYVTSHFFKSDILSFAIIFVVLMSAVMVDVVLAIAAILIKTAALSTSSGDPEQANELIGHFYRIDWARNLIAVVFPNVNVKQAVYNLKIQNWNNCRLALADTFNCNFCCFCCCCFV